MLIDLHVHTTRYSPCARASAEAIMATAVERGLDAMVITEHHAVWGDAELAELRDTFPQLQIFRAVEVTTDDREDLLIYGLPPGIAFTAGQPTTAVLAQARAAGAAIVLAHPFRYHDFIAEALHADTPDACEGWSPNVFAFLRPKIRHFCQQTGSGLIAASDAHTPAYVGAFATRFHHAIANEQELATALRDKAYTPFRNPTRLAALEADLPERVAQIRRGLADGLDPGEIQRQVGGALSTINHVAAGRFPSLIGND